MLKVYKLENLYFEHMNGNEYDRNKFKLSNDCSIGNAINCRGAMI
jgi:hypothetical protein